MCYNFIRSYFLPVIHFSGHIFHWTVCPLIFPWPNQSIPRKYTQSTILKNLNSYLNFFLKICFYFTMNIFFFLITSYVIIIFNAVHIYNRGIYVLGRWYILLAAYFVTDVKRIPSVSFCGTIVENIVN